MKISIPTHLVSDESMGDGWLDQAQAATAFAAFLTNRLPTEMWERKIHPQDAEIEFEARRTGDSGQVNNPSAYVTVDGLEDEPLSFQVQALREHLWERFCATCPESLYSIVIPEHEQTTGEPG